MFKEIHASKSSITKRKLVHGIGVNDAEYTIRPSVNGKTQICPFYAKWSDMISRCYSGKMLKRNPSYTGCSVCEEWLIFSNFKKWMTRQDWQGKAIDKDIINPGNKIYSPEDCAFVEQSLNNLLESAAASRGKYPKGVCWDKAKGKFRAEANRREGSKFIGRFNTEKEASNAYIKVKVKIILEAATEQSDPRVANGLRLHVDILLAGLSG